MCSVLSVKSPQPARPALHCCCHTRHASPDRATVEQCNYVSNEPSLDTGHVICVLVGLDRKNRVISRIRMLYTHINHGKGYN